MTISLKWFGIPAVIRSLGGDIVRTRGNVYGEVMQLGAEMTCECGCLIAIGAGQMTPQITCAPHRMSFDELLDYLNSGEGYLSTFSLGMEACGCRTLTIDGRLAAKSPCHKQHGRGVA